MKSRSSPGVCARRPNGLPQLDQLGDGGIGPANPAVQVNGQTVDRIDEPSVGLDPGGAEIRRPLRSGKPHGAVDRAAHHVQLFALFPDVLQEQRRAVEGERVELRQCRVQLRAGPRTDHQDLSTA